MDLPSLLRKELRWGRRHLPVLLAILVVLPALFAVGTLAFDTVLPTDAPVAVVPQSESVTHDEITITRGAVTFFSRPVTYDSRERAFDALERERVYAIVTVPPGVLNASTPATFDVYVDGSIVPYHQASKAVVSVMNGYLHDNLPGNVRVERHVVGEERALSEYLLPTFLLLVLMLLALAYVPHALATEEPVFERLRLETSLYAVVGAKLVFFTGVAVLPIAVFQAASAYFGYDVAVAAPGAVAAALLTFVATCAVGMAVTLATRFRTWGRLVNVLVFFALAGFSGLFYPAGFFSAHRREFVRLVPTHYAVVTIRGVALRGTDAAFYADWLVGLAAVAALSLGALALSVRYYEVTQ